MKMLFALVLAFTALQGAFASPLRAEMRTWCHEECTAQSGQPPYRQSCHRVCNDQEDGNKASADEHQ